MKFFAKVTMIAALLTASMTAKRSVIAGAQRIET
jgi:hypothetical protein